MKRPDTGQNIALSVTVLTALLLLIFLCAVHLQPPVQAPQQKSDAISMADIEPEQIELEDMFIEPILEDAGEPDNADDLQDAPLADGEPELSDLESDRLVVNGPNPVQNTETEPKVATPAPSTVKTATPSPKDEPDSKVSSQMGSQFAAHNGNAKGETSTAASGSGGSGNGVRGDMGQGRKLEKYVLPSGFSISKSIQVTVTVDVKADGTVVPGSVKVITSLKDATLRTKIQNCSAQTVWTPKKGAPIQTATIYWTLVPGTK